MSFNVDRENREIVFGTSSYRFDTKLRGLLTGRTEMKLLRKHIILKIWIFIKVKIDSVAGLDVFEFFYL